MEQLIPVTNAIRDALADVELEVGIDLPQIAVVGGQSAGKSSILESLVGRAFLPTGTGVVTRRPLLLRLSNTSSSGSDREWGEFGHLPGKEFDDFREIRNEIARDTDRVCGDQQAISSTPLVLKISSPNVIDLTLIDLPGIARVPVGDQPLDIEAQIRQLALEFITNPRSLILAVVAGNADLATADALALAREVDPNGTRTIGVVTKLDLVDHGMDVVPILEGRVYPLRMGFVGVVCRSFRDVQRGKHLKEQAQAEMQFFRTHSAYRNVAHRCGMAYLARHLNRVLLDHLRGALPDIKREASQLIHEQEVELQGYGETITQTPSEQGQLLLGLFTKFAGRFGDSIEGKLAGQQEMTHQSQLVGRARIDFIFGDLFAKTVREFDSCKGLSDDEIRVAIRNATGPRATLFVPEAAFELLVRKQISKLLDPCLQCADFVFDELQRVLLMSELPEFRRFSNLREQVFSVVRGIMRRCMEPTVQMIKDLVDIELAYINTNHPDFSGGLNAMRSAGGAGGAKAGTPSQRSPLMADCAVSGAPGAVASANAGGSAHLPAAASGSSLAASSDRAPSPQPLDGGGGGGGSGAGGGCSASGSSVAAAANGGVSGGGCGAGGAPQADAQSDAAPGNASGFFSFFRQPRGRQASDTSASEEARTRAASADMGIVPRGAGQAAVGTGKAASASGSVGAGRIDEASSAANEAAAYVASAYGGTLKLPDVPLTITPASEPPSQRERVEVGIIKKLLGNYLAIVKKNIADSVPKTIMCFLVSALKDVIQSECVAQLYKEDRFEELLQEAKDVQGRRARCQERLKALYKVIEVAEQIRSTSHD